MSSKLKTTLYVIAVYLAILGALFAFAPRTAESVMGISLPDAALTLLYGQVSLTLAFMAYLTASGGLSSMVNGFLVLFGGHILVFIYQLTTGISTFAQVGPPLVVSVIFTVLLFWFRRS